MANIARYSTSTTPNPITEYRESVNTPDFSEQPNILFNPDISSVSGFAMKYWKHVDGAVELMTEQERDAVDAAEAAALIAQAKAAAKNLYDALDSMGRVIRAVAKVAIDNDNRNSSRIREMDAAVAAATSLNDLKTRWGNLSSIPDRTYAQAKTAIEAIVDGEQ